MPPDKPTDVKATTWVVVVVFVAVLALVGAIFNGAWIGLFRDDDTPESSETGPGSQEEIYALQTQVTLQETVIAQQQEMSGNRSDSPIVPSQESITDCAFLLATQLDQLKLASSVSEAIRQAEDYAGNLQNDYRSDEIIPAGVVIATDLQNADISNFPVSPIKNQGGWGLFLTVDEFLAPNDGTYWCIR